MVPSYFYVAQPEALYRRPAGAATTPCFRKSHSNHLHPAIGIGLAIRGVLGGVRLEQLFELLLRSRPRICRRRRCNNLMTQEHNLNLSAFTRIHHGEGTLEKRLDSSCLELPVKLRNEMVGVGVPLPEAVLCFKRTTLTTLHLVHSSREVLFQTRRSSNLDHASDIG